MEIIGIIQSVSEPKVINGNQGDVKIVDVVVNGGDDVLLMSAFDKMADAFVNGTLRVGYLCKVRATASLRSKEGRTFQSIRMDACAKLLDASPTF